MSRTGLTIQIGIIRIAGVSADLELLTIGRKDLTLRVEGKKSLFSSIYAIDSKDIFATKQS